jgi:ribosome biogenesis ATPase
LVSGVSGGSEKNIRELFDSAREASPCVIFLDELDAVCSSREDSSKEMTGRIIAQLLSSMDSVTNGEILLIGATSRPEVLDSSLRRAGRFDREISIGIPTG